MLQVRWIHASRAKHSTRHGCCSGTCVSNGVLWVDFRVQEKSVDNRRRSPSWFRWNPGRRWQQLKWCGYILYDREGWQRSLPHRQCRKGSMRNAKQTFWLLHRIAELSSEENNKAELCRHTTGVCIATFSRVRSKNDYIVCSVYAECSVWTRWYNVVWGGNLFIIN